MAQIIDHAHLDMNKGTYSKSPNTYNNRGNQDRNNSYVRNQPRNRSGSYDRFYDQNHWYRSYSNGNTYNRSGSYRCNYGNGNSYTPQGQGMNLQIGITMVMEAMSTASVVLEAKIEAIIAVIMDTAILRKDNSSEVNLIKVINTVIN